MPTYEYVCAKCDHQFEKVQPIADKSLTVCPKELCGQKKWGKGKVKRAIVSGAGLIFKGSGFYITDYRSDKYKEAAKKDTAPPPPLRRWPSGDSKPSGESKPAKTESKPESKAVKTSSAKKT